MLRITRPPETAWDQGGFNKHPSALNKVELSQVVSSKLFMTASYAYFRGGFELVPHAGTAVNNTSIAQNAFFAGPSSGGAGAAAFRAISAADISSALGAGGNAGSCRR